MEHGDCKPGPETYDALWKVPGRGEDLRLGLYVELRAACASVTELRTSMVNDSYTERWAVRCAGGLAGATIHIAGLTATTTDVLVRLERLDGTTQVTRLTPSAPSFVVEDVPGAMQVARTYAVLGIEHILGGLDHLLFVLALMILVRGRRRLIATVTAFTLAHSLTLAGATLGFVHVPGAPVEATIALSIVFVAAEIIHSRQGRADLTERSPWVVAFAFGLLHGFGFASALNEVGLPQSAIPIALLFFNVGVEIGQLLFIASVFTAIALARQITRRIGVSQPAWAWRFPPYAIGSVAALDHPAHRCILKNGSCASPLVAAEEELLTDDQVVLIHGVDRHLLERDALTRVLARDLEGGLGGELVAAGEEGSEHRLAVDRDTGRPELGLLDDGCFANRRLAHRFHGGDVGGIHRVHDIEVLALVAQIDHALGDGMKTQRRLLSVVR